PIKYDAWFLKRLGINRLRQPKTYIGVRCKSTKNEFRIDCSKEMIVWKGRRESEKMIYFDININNVTKPNFCNVKSAQKSVIFKVNQRQLGSFDRRKFT